MLVQTTRLRPRMLSPFRPLTSGKKPCALPRLLPLLLMAITPSASVAEQTDQVVAVVNADPITAKTLADACVMRYGSDVLDNMINRHLILQACKQNGIEVTSGEVRDEIMRIAAKFGLTVESYLQLLQEERDIAPDQYSREIVWPMLALRRLVSDEVEPTEEEFNRAFLSLWRSRQVSIGDGCRSQKGGDASSASGRESRPVF